MGMVHARAHGGFRTTSLGGPWARGRLGGAELILLHSFFLLVALGSFSLASRMLPNYLVAIVLVPSDAQ